MLKRKNFQVELGDRFSKAGDRYGRVWEVVYVWVAVDGITHARLAVVGSQSDLRTVAAPVLADTQFWEPVTRTI